MSKARLVITAVLIEGRSQSQVARDYGVSQSWISRLIARYTHEGEAAFEPRSRRPHTSPTRLPQATIDLIVALRTDAGRQRPRRRTPHHRLAPAAPPPPPGLRGLHQPPPARRRPRRHPAPTNGPNRPTSASPPNNPTNAGKPTSPTGASPAAPTPKSSAGSTTTPATPSPSPHTSASPAPIVLAEFPKAMHAHGIPHSTLTDNGMVFTTRLAGGKRRTQQIRSRTPPPRSPPNQLHPQPPHHLRQSRTLPPNPQTLAPPTNPSHHHSTDSKPNSTPSSTNTTTAAHTDPCPTTPPRPPSTPARPKADPATRIDTHDRVRTDRVGETGIRHPARQRTPPPHRRRPHPLPNPRPDPRPGPQHQNHQRRHRRSPPRPHPRPHQGLPTHRSTQRPNTKKGLNPMQVQTYSDVLRHHMVAGTGFEPATSGL